MLKVCCGPGECVVDDSLDGKCLELGGNHGEGAAGAAQVDESMCGESGWEDIGEQPPESGEGCFRP